MAVLLLLFTVPLTVLCFEYCPCNLDPLQCDADCCCDTECSAEQVSTFSCKPFLISDSKLCCRDSLKLTADNEYGNVRECKSNLICLDETPSGFGFFSNNSKAEELPFDVSLDAESTFSYNESSQYRDTDLLLRKYVDSSPQPFVFPVNFHGDICAKSPVLFYSEIHSSCRRSVASVNSICKSNSLLDYQYYLNPLLKFPNKTAEVIDPTSSETFYCLDSSSGRKGECTPSKTPEIKDGKCINVVSDVEIRLLTSTDVMKIDSASVSVTLTSLPVSQKTFKQSFTLTYKPISKTNTISGNFGYMPRSHILSGTADDKDVAMSSDSELRVLSLFKSADCSTFSDHLIEFGIGYYTGCKLQLPFYNFKVMSGQRVKYCSVLKNLTDSIFKINEAIIVGKTGRSSTSDSTQWVKLKTDPENPAPVFHENAVTCDDITTHITYRIFYTEIGEVDNLQAVITTVSVQHSKQNVELYCSSNTCSTLKQQYLVLSNSVEFVLNPASTEARFKSYPRAALILPVDFFYPLASSGNSFSGGFVVLCLLLCCFLRTLI